MRKIVVLFFILLAGFQLFAQIDENKTGAWYIYSFNGKFNNSNFGLLGDVQYRNWNLLGDLEQLLLRGGLSYQPKGSNLRLSINYANITSGIMGDEKTTKSESRICQQLVLLQNPINRVFLRHRFRYEQRFKENQNFRTRYRYNLSMNIPINSSQLETGAIYLSLYNELFINGQRKIADDKNVELFDRNRSFLGFGYIINDKLKIRAGWMKQITDNWSKAQWQLSLSQKIF